VRGCVRSESCDAPIFSVTTHKNTLTSKHASMASVFSGKLVSCMNALDRRILVDYMCELARAYMRAKTSMDNTLFLGVRLLDTLLAHEVLRVKEYQCAGMTALFVAHKYNCRNRTYKIEDFRTWSAGCVTPNDIRAMEVRILRACDYALGVPTTWDFAVAMLSTWSAAAPLAHLNTHSKVAQAVWYILFVIQKFPTFCEYDPYVLARAAVRFVQSRVGCTCMVPARVMTLQESVNECACLHELYNAFVVNTHTVPVTDGDPDSVTDGFRNFLQIPRGL